MISLTNEWTDGKGSRARGWLFFDANCGFCTRFARRVAPVLAARDIAVAPLQDPRVGVLLGLSGEDLLREMRVVFTDGDQFGGADACVALAREVWWARPLVWLAHLPGAFNAMRRSYRWFAARRRCVAEVCRFAAAQRHG